MVKTKVFTVPLRNLKFLSEQVDLKIGENKPLYIKFEDTEILISNLVEMR